MRKWRSENPPTREQKYRSNARSYLHTYIKRGKISKKSCEVCGVESPIEAHHEDYSKPLDVNWLCRPHHIMLTQGLIEL